MPRGERTLDIFLNTGTLDALHQALSIMGYTAFLDTAQKEGLVLRT